MLEPAALPFAPTYADAFRLEYDVSGAGPEPVDAKLEKLVQALQPHRQRLTELAPYQIMDVEVICHGYVHSMPSLRLAPELLRQLAELHLPINIRVRASGEALPDEA